jgi:hypothetical protein
MGAQPHHRDLVQPDIIDIPIRMAVRPMAARSGLSFLPPPSRYPEALTAFEICECPPDEVWAADPPYRG